MSVTCGRLITSYFLDRAVRSRDKSVFTKWAQLTASIVDKSVLGSILSIPIRARAV
jgi:hypothetical protein